MKVVCQNENVNYFLILRHTYQPSCLYRISPVSWELLEWNWIAVVGNSVCTYGIMYLCINKKYTSKQSPLPAPQPASHSHTLEPGISDLSCQRPCFFFTRGSSVSCRLLSLITSLYAPGANFFCGHWCIGERNVYNATSQPLKEVLLSVGRWMMWEKSLAVFVVVKRLRTYKRVRGTAQGGRVQLVIRVDVRISEAGCYHHPIPRSTITTGTYIYHLQM